jgi:hypothetical protein
MMETHKGTHAEIILVESNAAPRYEGTWGADGCRMLCGPVLLKIAGYEYGKCDVE